MLSHTLSFACTVLTSDIQAKEKVRDSMTRGRDSLLLIEVLQSIGRWYLID